MTDPEREREDEQAVESDGDDGSGSGKVNDPLTRSEVADEVTRTDWGTSPSE